MIRLFGFLIMSRKEYEETIRTLRAAAATATLKIVATLLEEIKRLEEEIKKLKEGK